MVRELRENACRGCERCDRRGRQVERDSGEAFAIPLDLREVTVTADAMHRRRETATQILDQGGDYALQVKSNPARLYENLQAFWKLSDPQGTTMNRTLEQRHGRIETRTVRVREMIDLVHVVHDWQRMERRRLWSRRMSSSARGKGPGRS